LKIVYTNKEIYHFSFRIIVFIIIFNPFNLINELSFF